MNPGRLIQDDAPWTITCLIEVDCAHLHIEYFSNPPLWSRFYSPLPPYIKPLPPLRCGDGLRDMSPPSSRWLAPENKPLFFISAPTSRVSASVAAKSWPCFWFYSYCRFWGFKAMVPDAKLIVNVYDWRIHIGNHFEHQRVFCISRNHRWPFKLNLIKGGVGWLTYIEHWLHARDCAKCFLYTYIYSIFITIISSP